MYAPHASAAHPRPAALDPDATFPEPSWAHPGLHGVTTADITAVPYELLLSGVTVLSLTAFAVGAVLLPWPVPRFGPPAGLVPRGRRVLDGVTVGLCLMFCAWVLGVADHGGAGSIVFWAVLANCCLAVAAIVATGLGGAGLVRSGAPSRPVPIVAAAASSAILVGLVAAAVGAGVDRAGALLGAFSVLAIAVHPFLPAGPGAADWDNAPPDAHGGVGTVPAQRTPDRSMPDESAVLRIDPFVGLGTRAELVAAMTAMRARPRSPGALLMISLDPPDGVGGGLHDEVLAETVRRVCRVVHAQAAWPAPGGAHVAVRWSRTVLAVLTGANALRAYGLGHQLVATLSEPVPVPAGSIGVSTSVGLTDLGAPSTDEVLRRAETALRRARQLGPGHLEWYDTSVEEAVQHQEAIERELPGALARRELDLVYQPIVDLVGGRPLAVEALLRWRHPSLGTLMPEDVIPAAVRTGAMGEIGEWVVGQACAQLAVWRRQGRDLTMAVNITPGEIGGSAFAEGLASVLRSHSLPADSLVIEIAEAGIVDAAGLASQVAAVRAVGVRTALDAFGAGPESLAHLRGLPIDMVKIGRSVFEAAPEDTPLVDLLVGVGRRLGVDVVAHGLEAPAQLAAVRTAGCRLGQGHIFARPQPAEHTEAYLDGFVRPPGHGRRVTAPAVRRRAVGGRP